MSDPWLTILRLLSVLVLVLANGFFVASEFALVAVRRSRIDELVARGVVGAKAVQRATRNLDHFIAATQLGITLASLALGWVGEPAVAHLLERAFGDAPGAATLSFIIAFTIITALHIVVGELAPKSIALQYPERTSLVIAQPLGVFDLVFRPFIVALNAIGRATVRLLGLRPPAGHEMVHSAEELRMLVQASGSAGVLEESERAIIARAFDFADFTARELMKPRTEVAAVPAALPGPALLDYVCEEGYSRYPVYGESTDEVLGIVHVKDLLEAVREVRLDAVTAGDLRQPAMMVPDTLPADELLERMQTENRRMAIVLDEFGGMAGVVTMENLLERLVGAMRDEHEPAGEPDAATGPDGSVVLDGLMLVGDANERFGLDLDERDFDTIGGYVFGRIGHLPQVGDSVDIDGRTLEVTEMDGLRVARVRLSPPQTADARAS